MFIGILQFELRIAGAESLKDKRRVVRSLKDRLHRAHQVSVAEIGALDTWTVAALGLTVAAGTPARAGQVLDAVLAKLHTLRDAELTHFHREIVKGEALLERALDTPSAPDAPFFGETDLAAADALVREFRP